MTLEWSRIDETTVVGRLTSTQGLQLVLETYFPNSAGGQSGTYAVDESRRAILGEKFFDNVFNHVARLVVMTDRPLMGSGAYPSLADLQAGMAGPGRLVPAVPNDSLQGAAGLEFADSAPAHFVAVIGWEKESLLNQASALLAPGKIDAILKEKAEAYAARRPTRERIVCRRARGHRQFHVLEYSLRPPIGSHFPQHQPPMGARLGRLGGGRVGLLFRRAPDQPGGRGANQRRHSRHLVVADGYGRSAQCGVEGTASVPTARSRRWVRTWFGRFTSGSRIAICWSGPIRA